MKLEEALKVTREKLEEFGEDEERTEFAYVTTRISGYTEDEAIAWLNKREEHYERKLSSVYCTDQQSQLFTDKQYVVTKLIHELKKTREVA